ncbi:MAG: HAMP domain-containing protein [Elusimicrobiales bacterium]|nr:HAMP domain-containing protein [Elusimicrobiales bacterium]
MTNRVRKKGKLFYKFLFIFLMISMIPLGIVSYYLVNLSRETLNRAIIKDQEALAVGFADTLANSVNSFKNVLLAVAHRSDFASMDTSKQQITLNSIMQLHKAFLDVSVVGIDGQETIRIGRFVQNTNLRDFSQNPVFKRAVKSGEFMGEIKRNMGSYPSLTIAIAIANPSNNQTNGVIIAKLSLNGLSGILKTSFPPSTHTRAAVIDSNGFLVAHSDSEEVTKPDAKLPDDILDVLLRNDAKSGGGEIILNSSQRVLGAFAEVNHLGWVVYIQRSVSVAYEASQKMLHRTYKVIFIVMIFVLFLGYAVSLVIVQPIQALREAAIKLGEGDFDYLPDLNMPNDEIGELAHTFVQMSEALKIKNAEVVSAQDELHRLNRSLENRVEARTRELKSAQDELIKKERLAAIGQMASVVGHEIRNPLAVINNSTYFIKTKLSHAGDVEPKISKHLSIIESEIKQANGIINEILGFARTKDLNPRVQPLHSYLEDLIMSFPFPKYIEFVKEFTTENPIVNVDTDELTQAIRNLMNNGIEVMPEKGTLTMRTVIEDNFVRIDIQDEGSGIPKDVLEKIFAPFFTTKARGTGLGLAVVKKVIDRHNGKVDAWSEVGKGTCFKLFLPLSAKLPKIPGE